MFVKNFLRNNTCEIRKKNKNKNVGTFKTRKTINNHQIHKIKKIIKKEIIYVKMS